MKVIGLYVIEHVHVTESIVLDGRFFLLVVSAFLIDLIYPVHKLVEQAFEAFDAFDGGGQPIISHASRFAKRLTSAPFTKLFHRSLKPKLSSSNCS